MPLENVTENLIKNVTGNVMDDLMIEHNQSAQRWETHIGQHLAVAEYQRSGDTLHFTHTGVPRELQGQGIASQLVKAALEYARQEHLTVVPHCSFVAVYIRRHPEYKELVHPDYRALV
jgi:predicted GNAT family acetyltransferase